MIDNRSYHTGQHEPRRRAVGPAVGAGPRDLERGPAAERDCRVRRWHVSESLRSIGIDGGQRGSFSPVEGCSHPSLDDRHCTVKRMTYCARNSTLKASWKPARHVYASSGVREMSAPELFDERCTLRWCLSPRTTCVQLPASQLPLVLAAAGSGDRLRRDQQRDGRVSELPPAGPNSVRWSVSPRRGVRGAAPPVRRPRQRRHVDRPHRRAPRCSRG